MKRVIICIVLFLGCIIISVYSSYKTESAGLAIAQRIEAMSAAIQSGDTETLTVQAAELCVLWEREEDVLAHFVRHSNLDSITIAMTRLAPLAAFGELGELSAELASIQRQMEHIEGTEKLMLDNLF